MLLHHCGIACLKKSSLKHVCSLSNYLTVASVSLCVSKTQIFCPPKMPVQMNRLHSIGLGREDSAATLCPVVVYLIYCPVANLAQIFIITL